MEGELRRVEAKRGGSLHKKRENMLWKYFGGYILSTTILPTTHGGGCNHLLKLTTVQRVTLVTLVTIVTLVTVVTLVTLVTICNARNDWRVTLVTVVTLVTLVTICNAKLAVLHPYIGEQFRKRYSSVSLNVNNVHCAPVVAL
jgi:hypothetical protein